MPPVVARQCSAAVSLPSPVGCASTSAVVGSRISSIGKSAAKSAANTETMPSASVGRDDQLAGVGEPVEAAERQRQVAQAVEPDRARG